MKLTAPFRGVRKGEIYPVDFAIGDDCPPELEAAAKALGCVDVKPVAKPAPSKKAHK